MPHHPSQSVLDALARLRATTARLGDAVRATWVPAESSEAPEAPPSGAPSAPPSAAASEEAVPPIDAAAPIGPFVGAPPEPVAFDPVARGPGRAGPLQNSAGSFDAHLFDAPGAARGAEEPASERIEALEEMPSAPVSEEIRSEEGQEAYSRRPFDRPVEQGGLERGSESGAVPLAPALHDALWDLDLTAEPEHAEPDHQSQEAVSQNPPATPPPPSPLPVSAPRVFVVRGGRAAPQAALVPVLAADADDALTDDIQADLVPIVVEEIQELLPEIDALMAHLPTGDPDAAAELHRKVHTLKGTVGMVGAKRARAVIHRMETVMESIDTGGQAVGGHMDTLWALLARAKALIQPLLDGSWATEVAPTTSGEGGAVSSSRPARSRPAVAAPSSVRVATTAVDEMIAAVNDDRLSGLALDVFLGTIRAKIKELDDNSQRVARLHRELELQAELQMQSRRAQAGTSSGTADSFDPLEFDRFTHLQELTRLIGEGLSDVTEVGRDISRALTESESARAHQRHAAGAAQTLLHRTRLTPADHINDRLHGVVGATAREMGKSVVFEMEGWQVEVDRMLLEKLTGPLEHILRNAVAHGIEAPPDRRAAGKPDKGTIAMRVRQDAARVLILVSDDGAGLRTDKVRARAIEKGLWAADRPMNDEDAAEMICTPGFSTAESVTGIAGRGVGMDVVRSEVLALGGRFSIESRPGRGMTVSITVPTSVAQAPVLVVEAGSDWWALPVEMVDRVVLLPASVRPDSSGRLPAAALTAVGGAEEGSLPKGARVPYRTLAFGAAPAATARPVVVCVDRGARLALEVDRLVQVVPVPVRPTGPLWAATSGLAGTVVLPDGNALFLLDPFRLEGPSAVRPEAAHPAVPAAPVAPLVLVVDDSLTVRKAAGRLLDAAGYRRLMAKDGQEALDVLRTHRPAVILMDIEMPRLNGLDAAQIIRSTPEIASTPIIMITSRTGDKHRARAEQIGVQEYLGKPFRDPDLLAALARWAPRVPS